MVTYCYRLPRLLLDSDITVPPTNGNETSGFYHGDSNFDSNMVIILAALLIALICALGLNSIVRCALRCNGRFSHGTDDDVAACLATSVGLKKEALSKIPVAVYEPGLRIPATDCPICLGEFVEGEDIRIFPRCNHGFHVKCIDKWLVLHSSCPNCRQPLIEHSMSGDAERVRVQIS
ncbi:hypothetical protein DH2020_022028 [Rehmannia glutinosa]|uniref:RING-type E3 ubiquitin transferase n=1 Tax=Rehmannia glutinosa TaxID=99300 RepID=A0ABR0WC51_REHGL